MTQTRRHDRQSNTRSQQLCRYEMTKIMQTEMFDTSLIQRNSEPLRHPVRLPRRHYVRRRKQRTTRHRHSPGRRTLRTLLAMRSQQLDCFDIEINTVGVLCSTVLQHRTTSSVDQPAHQPDPSMNQINIRPRQPEDFATPGARGRSEPHQHHQQRIGPTQRLKHLGHHRGLRHDMTTRTNIDARRVGRRVRPDPIPTNSLSQRGMHDTAYPPDRRRG